MQLYEKYRPQSFAEVLGQKKAVKQIKSVLENNWGGQAFWLAGASGIGKTTLARIIANHGAERFFITEYDSADSLNAAEIKDIDCSMRLYGWGKGGRCFVINEAHGLRKPVIRRLLGLLERIPPHVIFLFTTTKVGQAGLFDEQIDAEPLLSRCIYIELTNQGLCNLFAQRAKEIAALENLDGKPIKDYVNLAKTSHNNMRTILQSVESGVMKR